MNREEVISMIGKVVIYRPEGMSNFAKKVLEEYGTVTSVGYEVAFVRYTGDLHSKATYFYDLHFKSIRETE